MAFKDALRSFLDRALESGEVQNQDQFAERFNLSRVRINQFLNGETAPVRTMIAILRREGYELIDCIDDPAVMAERADYVARADQLLKRKDRIGEMLREQIDMIEARAKTLKPHSRGRTKNKEDPKAG